jgi:tetratricopeptide (TPR) repeat protein
MRFVLLSMTCLLASVAHATPPWLAQLESAAEGDESGRMALQVAQAHARHGQLNAALKWANRARAAGVHGLRVNLVRGDAYLHAEEYADAVREFFEVVVQAPQNAHAQVHLWLALRDAQLPPSLDGDRLRALLRDAGYFMPIAARRPRQRAGAQALVAKGYDAVRRGTFKVAIDRFQAAVVLDDTLPDPFRGLGIAWGRLDDRARSLAAYRLYLAQTSGETRERRQIRRIVTDAERHRGLGLTRR